MLSIAGMGSIQVFKSSEEKPLCRELFIPFRTPTFKIKLFVNMATGVDVKPHQSLLCGIKKSCWNNDWTFKTSVTTTEN